MGCSLASLIAAGILAGVQIQAGPYVLWERCTGETIERTFVVPEAEFTEAILAAAPNYQPLKKCDRGPFRVRIHRYVTNERFQDLGSPIFAPSSSYLSLTRLAALELRLDFDIAEFFYLGEESVVMRMRAKGSRPVRRVLKGSDPLMFRTGEGKSAEVQWASIGEGRSLSRFPQDGTLLTLTMLCDRGMSLAELKEINRAVSERYKTKVRLHVSEIPWFPEGSRRNPLINPFHPISQIPSQEEFATWPRYVCDSDGCFIYE